MDTLTSIALGAVGFIAGWNTGAWYARRKQATLQPPHPCQTMHDLVLIERQDAQQATLFGPVPGTLVLKVCQRCGQHHIFHLLGEWSLSDLHKKRSDIDILDSKYGPGKPDPSLNPFR